MLTADSNKRIKIIMAILLAIIIFISITAIFLYSLSGHYAYLNTGDYIARDINTPLKLWLNGYLSLFFKTKTFGFLMFLAVPSLFYYLFSIDKRPQWQRALLFVYVLSFLLISIKGYTNFRYAYTLYPFTIIGVLGCIYELYKKFNYKRKLIIICFVMLLSANLFDNFHRYKRTIAEFNRPSKVVELIDYINTLNINEKNNILVINITDYYYYSNSKSLMYYTIQRKINKTANLLNLIKTKNIKYILADDYIFQRSEYNLISNVIKTKAKLIKRTGTVSLYSL
ncbi:MAG: hypothetical protein WCK67_10390 [bacterium]